MPRPDVLPEAELSAVGRAGAPGGRRRVADAAEDAHDDHGVHRSVPGGQPLGDAVDDLDGNRYGPRPLDRRFTCAGSGSTASSEATDAG